MTTNKKKIEQIEEIQKIIKEKIMQAMELRRKSEYEQGRFYQDGKRDAYQWVYDNLEDILKGVD